MDVERVCCMCGDIGFPDKIFRCIHCHHRYQHSYCSSSYSESSERPELCNWCLTDETKTSANRGLSKKPTAKLDVGSENSGNKIKQQDREEGSSEKGKPPTGAPSPRTRRYKLLKDVMC